MRYISLMLSIVLVALESASATTYIVNPDGTGDFPSIQAAIDAATDGDIIELGDGTFTGDGNRDIDFLGKAITVRSYSSDPEACVIDCEGTGDEPHRGFYFHSGEGLDSRVEGLGIRGGYADGYQDEERWGGGILAQSGSSVSVTDCILADNYASRGGAGLRLSGPIHIERCTFVGNTSGEWGGGLACFGSPATIRGCTFVGNTGVRGGAVVLDACDAEVSSCLFFANSADEAGAVYCYSWFASCNFTDCTFEANSAGSGAAIKCFFSQVSVDTCLFLENVAESDGGALHCIGDADVRVSASWLLRNSASSGGGAYCREATLRMTGCDLVANSGEDGSGIHLSEEAHVVLDRTLIAYGLDGPAVVRRAYYGGITLACCDIFGNAGGDWTEELADQLGINGNICEDPIFCAPEVGDFSLRADSPCAPHSPPNPECDLIGVQPVGCMAPPGILHVVSPDGSGDHPTIQAAIDNAGYGDTIELTAGRFTGEGNRDIDFRGKTLILRSQDGYPDSCIIDCEDSGKGIVMQSWEGPDTHVEGVKITRAFGSALHLEHSAPTISNCQLLFGYAETGGGVFCDNSAPTLTDCTISGNLAYFGGGIFSDRDSVGPSLFGCTLADNFALYVGGGMYAEGGRPSVVSCTFCSNTADQAGGMWFGAGADPVIENTIIAFGIDGGAIRCTYNGTPILVCCDLYGNVGGDWVGFIADQYGVNGNISEDPRFCDLPNGDYHLWNSSPCADADCGLMGAWPVGCGTIPSEAPLNDDPRPVPSLLVSPNPGRSPMDIVCTLPAGLSGQPLDLSIFDAQGRLLRRLATVVAPGNAYTGRWDGTDSEGRVVGAGPYFCRLRHAGGQIVRRFVLIR
jgi:hypothetical protein